jgi:hypothetical protein
VKTNRLLLAMTVAIVFLAGTSLQAQNVVTYWNAIASTTIVKNGGRPLATSSVWFAYTSISVYDAVNAISGQFQPFYYDGTAPEGASDEAAAAHRILVNYFPAQQLALDAEFNDSLAKITATPDAKAAGIAGRLSSLPPLRNSLLLRSSSKAPNRSNAASVALPLKDSPQRGRNLTAGCSLYAAPSAANARKS